MAKKNVKGAFITFEGSEGSGKSTHSKLLCQYLKDKGLNVIHIYEPGSTVLGDRLRNILLDPKNKNISYLSEMLLYMAARAQIVEEIIRPALKMSKIVICDRFLDATVAYQGYGAGINIKHIKQIGSIVTGGLKPDLTLLLDLPAEKGLRRAGVFKDRIERRPLNFHEKVRSGYLKMARLEPKRIKVIRVDDNKTQTQEEIRKLVDKLLWGLKNNS